MAISEVSTEGRPVRLCGRDFVRAVVFICGGSRWRRQLTDDLEDLLGKHWTHIQIALFLHLHLLGSLGSLGSINGITCIIKNIQSSLILDYVSTLFCNSGNCRVIHVNTGSSRALLNPSL